MPNIDTIFYLVILIFSIIIHEIAHGYTAEYFGDSTARDEGRLTLNPIKHIDPFGSIILPALLIISGSSFLIGWAKPVPYNPDNLNNKKLGTIAVALAGILVNFLIAIIFGLILRFSFSIGLSGSFNYIVSLIIIVNLMLGIFNLFPIPPLDGSRILFQLLPYKWYRVEEFCNIYGFFILIVFIFLFSDVFSKILYFSYKLLVGSPLVF